MASLSFQSAVGLVLTFKFNMFGHIGSSVHNGACWFGTTQNCLESTPDSYLALRDMVWFSLSWPKGCLGASDVVFEIATILDRNIQCQSSPFSSFFVMILFLN